ASFLGVLTREELERDFARDHKDGLPEVRAAALEALVPRVPKADADSLVRHAFADRDAEVRRAAMKIIHGPRWLRHARGPDWVMGRLVDSDRAVRVEAIRFLRRTGV